MSLTLYHSPATRSIRAMWLLEEMQLPYRLETIKYDSAYFASDEFRAINPMGKIPALVDDGALIVESTAIMEYLLQRHGPSELCVQPSDPEYGTYVQWFHMAESGMTHYVAVNIGNKFDQDPYRVSDAFDEYCRYQVKKGLGMLEPLISDREYLLQRGFSAADVSLGATLFLAKTYTGTKFSPVVDRYFDTLLARPAMQKVLSDAQHLKARWTAKS